MPYQQETREQVSRRYAKAVAAPCDAEIGTPVPKSVAVKTAGYDASELAVLPHDAVVNSFGCGDPVAFSRLQPRDVVVDLGCGAGIDLLLAAKKVGASGQVIGIDMTEEMLAKARLNVALVGLTNVEVRKGLIEELPIKNASIDWVISNCVIVLSPEKERVFAEIARVLKPGGRMLVSDIVAEDLPAAAREDLGSCCSCVSGAITQDEYRAGLRRAGLADIDIQTRIAYSAEQLEALVESELRETGEAGCCENTLSNAPSLQESIRQCADKVLSARIFARKPASPAPSA